MKNLHDRTITHPNISVKVRDVSATTAAVVLYSQQSGVYLIDGNIIRTYCIFELPFLSPTLALPFPLEANKDIV